MAEACFAPTSTICRFADKSQGAAAPLLGFSGLTEVDLCMQKLQKTLLLVFLCACQAACPILMLPDLPGLTCMVLPVASPLQGNFL